MPLQNRVTPSGEIVAAADRGLFTGNRGILHDETQTIRRRWANKAWICCVLEYKGVRRAVMTGRRWTELFFLDEATALAAGHRPCFACRRADAEAFRAAWARGNGTPPPRAAAMDAVLHAERLHGRARRFHALDRPLAALPDGAMARLGVLDVVVAGGIARRWTGSGYARDAVDSQVGAAALLTPPSTVRALQAGYRPALHPSLNLT